MDDSNTIAIINDPIVKEGDIAEFTIQLAHPLQEAQQLEITITPQTAQQDVDYELPQTSISIPQGVSEITVEVPTFIDDIDEVDETFLVEIQEISRPVSVIDGESIGTISATDIIRADDEKYTVLRGEKVTLSDIITDDSLNGQPATLGSAGNVKITDISDGSLGIVFSPITGVVAMSGEAPSGTYTLEYTLCSVEDSNLCDSATVTIEILDANLSLEKTSKVIDVDGDGFITNFDKIEYTFNVINNGDLAVYNITIDDPLVEVSGGPIDLAPGQSDKDTFKATYNITEQDMNNTEVLNQAKASGQADDPREGREGELIQVVDFSHNPATSNVDDLTIPENDTDPAGNTVTPISGGGVPVPIVIYNGITPNGDGNNETFRIKFLDLYPDNTLQIFNRWGVKVFEQDSYGQDFKEEFDGHSNGDITIVKGQKLPEGTYYYVLNYLEKNTGKTQTRSGYIYLTR